MPHITRAQLVAYAAFAILVVALGVRFMQRQQPASTAAGVAATGSAPRSTGADAVRVERPPSAAATVHVAGAVRRPGVYHLPAGARVQDAVRRAGGARRGGDVNAVNLAAKVVDGQQVVVPRRPGGGAGGAAAAASAPGG